MVMTGVHRETFGCFGGPCAIEIRGSGQRGHPAQAAAWAKDHLLSWHLQFSRFLPDSELSCLNTDPRGVVPASPLLIDLAAAVAMAGEVTDGVVDGTLVGALEDSGYGRHRVPSSGPLSGVSAAVDRPRLSAASGHPGRAWSQIAIDREGGTVSRPAGIQLDSGGLAKGLLADVLAGWLGTHQDVLVDLGGDLAIGGSDPAPRTIEVLHPFDGSVAHAVELVGGGMATSATTRRRWIGPDGGEAHHLLDPSTGRPAFTGLVQVTALAPTALEAEIIAKWALLGGPPGARVRLAHGGVIINDLGDVTVIAPPSPSRRGPARAAPRGPARPPE